MQTTKSTTSKKAASFRRPEKPKTAPSTIEAGAVADAQPEQCPESNQNERAILDPQHPQPDVNRRGRKPKYRKEYARIAKAMCRQGATDYDLARVRSCNINDLALVFEIS
jgi:hypothetical protein